MTNVSLSVIPVNPLPSPTKVPLNVPPLNVVADILPDVPISKVTALSTDAKSIVSAVATNELPSFCEIVNVLELILKSFINVSVSPVILYGVKPELPTICNITSLSPLVGDCVTVPPVLNELVSVVPPVKLLKSNVYVLPSFLVNVANAVPLSYVEPVVKVSVTPVTLNVPPVLFVNVIVSIDSL